MATFMRPVAEKLFNALMLDVWPDALAVSCDFGLDGWGGSDPEKVYECYNHLVRKGEITLEQLNEALGDGPALTALVNGCASNPHPGIVIHTAYDGM